MRKVQFKDISHWKKEPHIHTGGTRDKFIFTSTNNAKYYFKKSLNKPNKDYKYEFWSEVIASQIGKWLGFDVLSYDVGYFDNEIGCLSKSIIKADDEEHNEGYGYIVRYFPDFEKSYKKTHSFQKIIGALKKHKLDHFIGDAIKMIIFDAIIGNTDRHSENWAIIVSNKKIKDALDEIDRYRWYKKIVIRIHFLIYTKGRVSLSKVKAMHKRDHYRFSPLYDNGSSLCRELSDERMVALLDDDAKFTIFVNKGKPDIRWNDKHLNHFELIGLIASDYPDEVRTVISNIRQKYNIGILANIIYNIDEKIPMRFAESKIPNKRKMFIIKYINYRINELITINGRIQ
jgi:hypothetical protein